MYLKLRQSRHNSPQKNITSRKIYLHDSLMFFFHVYFIVFAFNTKSYSIDFLLFLLLESNFGWSRKTFLLMFRGLLPKARVAIPGKISMHSNFMRENITCMCLRENNNGGYKRPILSRMQHPAFVARLQYLQEY